VPIFAFFSAGVLIGGWSGLQSALSDPIAVGIVAGLVVGKPIGILVATLLTSRITRRPLQAGLTWPDVTGVAMLGGIGFTVSLLIGELAFGGGTVADDHAKVAVLTGSVAAAALASVLLRIRNRRYGALYDEENRDDDQDGIPDLYEQR
jgi:Na+:H+ antiporter, NhaA family